jgi:hypothetical protein
VLSLSHCQWLPKILMSACSVLLLFHSISPHCLLLAACTASAEVAAHLILLTVSRLILRTGHTCPLLAHQFRSYWSYLAFATRCCVYSQCRNLQQLLSQTWSSAISGTIHKEGNSGVSGKSWRGEGEVWSRSRRWTRGACKVAFDPLPRAPRLQYISSARPKTSNHVCIFVWGGVRQEVKWLMNEALEGI